MLISEGYDRTLLDRLQAAAEAEGAALELIGPHIGGVKSNGQETVTPHHAIAGAPSVLFDTVVLAVTEAGVESLKQQAAALNFVRDAYAHLKIIGCAMDAKALLDMAGVKTDDGILEVDSRDGVIAYVEAAKNGRLWARATVIKA